MLSSSDPPFLKKISGDEAVYRAGWIAVSSKRIIENGYVRVKCGKIIETGHIADLLGYSGRILDAGPGVISPGTINAHTHIELSFLEGKLDTSSGFRKWVKDLIALRNDTSCDDILFSAREALLRAAANGTAYFADISTLGLSGDIFKGTGIHGTGFHEYLGNTDSFTHKGFQEDSGNLALSFAAHAPHTTSPELIRLLKKMTSSMNLPLSIHLDESDDEREFITKANGEWADFLTSRYIEWKSWPLPSVSPVFYLDGLGVIDRLTLCVHVCGAGRNDLQVLKERQASICICPRSNMNLHGVLPDIKTMISLGINPCIGTDSLASSETLSVFDEIRFLADRFSCLDSKTLFRMATENGAECLGVSHLFGTLENGREAFLVYSDMVPKRKKDVFDSFVFSKKIEVL